MKIRVLKNTEAASCPRGISIKTYYAGEIYDIFNELADVFLSQGWGETVEQKAINKSPENKAIFTSPENKKENPEKENNSEIGEISKKKGRPKNNG